MTLTEEQRGALARAIDYISQLPTNELAGLQLRKMFPRRIWPVDFGPVRPHRTPRPRTVLATYFEKCPQIRISSQELLPPCLSKHFGLRTSESWKPYFSGISECLNLLRGVRMEHSS